MLGALINKIFLYTCVICNSHECDQFDLCYKCLNQMVVNMRLVKNKDKPLDSLCTIYDYALVAELLVLKLKFQKQECISPIIAAVTIDKFLSTQAVPDIVTGVPLHYFDFCKRGFNQSLAIAKEIHRYMLSTKAIFIPDLITKVKHTKKQGLLNKEQRAKNLLSAYRVNKSIKNKSIVVVDDVVTTGSTLNQLATDLKRSGASEVYGWAFCHA